MDKKEKVLGHIGMLVHAYYPMDARVRREAECLTAAGFEVRVVSTRRDSARKGFRKSSHEIVNGVHIYYVPLVKKRGNKLRYFFEYSVMTLFGIWKLALLHLSKRFDVVHIHNMPDLLVVAGLVPKWTGANLVLDVHDPMTELFQANYHLSESHLLMRMLRIEEWVCYRLADHLLTVSTPMAENVAKKRGCAVEAIKVVHNFPDLTSFPVREDRRQWPYNRDGIKFLYSGTVTEHYRLDIAIRALAKVSQFIPNIRFQILGVGNRLQEMLTLAKELGIGDRVEHLQPVHIEKVKDVMADADVGITTHQSGDFADLYFSTKIVEFMTQGLPVISSRTGTIEKYIPEDAIFYFEPLQVEDLVRQILTMYYNPGLVLDKIINSKKVVSKLDWREEESRLVSLYGELVSEKKSVKPNRSK